jgi:hypothetical protein
MSVKKRGRPRKFSDEAYRRIIEWQRFTDLCKELGVPKKTAEWIRTKHRQVFQ